MSFGYQKQSRYFYLSISFLEEIYSVSQENVDFFNTVQQAQAKMAGLKTTLKLSNRS